MSQTILIAVIAVCALIQAIFLLNHQYLVRGTLLSAVSGLVCLVGLELCFPALGLAAAAPSCLISAVFGIPGCIFLLLIKLICGL